MPDEQAENVGDSKLGRYVCNATEVRLLVRSSRRRWPNKPPTILVLGSSVSFTGAKEVIRLFDPSLLAFTILAS